MARYTHFYQLATYYDIALQRDVSAQMEFICDLFFKVCSRSLESLLDIACGPGYHAAEAARRGLRAVGLDLMPEMIEYARRKLDVGLVVEWLTGDMREFRLSKPVDMAICVFDGIDCLLENADVIQHLRCVAANLNQGGLYLVENAHPRECSLMEYGDFEFYGERDDTKVSIQWAINHPQIDLITSISDVEIMLRIFEDGNEQTLFDKAQERVFTPQELRLLVDASQVFDIVGWYGAYRLDQPFDHSPSAHTMLLILQKRD